MGLQGFIVLLRTKPELFNTKNEKMKRVLLLSLLSVTLAIMLTRCEKHPHNSEVNNNVVLKTGNILYIRGHIYVWVERKGYVHSGYYMRQYRETGLRAWLFGKGCYGFSGNCLPEVVIKAVSPITDAENDEALTNEVQHNLGEDIVQFVNQTYSEPIVSILDSTWEEQYEFLMEQFIPKCQNFPSDLIKDFSKGLLVIKQFPEGLHIVKNTATEYDDIGTYDW